MEQTVEARFVRVGDFIDGHEVVDRQMYNAAFVGMTVEFYFDTRPPLTCKLSTDMRVVRAEEPEYGYSHADKLV
jgi:hypothetical protein